MRFDRQVRLWQNTGQSRIENSKILCVGSGFLMWETLKNLILGGFGSITIVESEWIHEKKAQLQGFNPTVSLIIAPVTQVLMDNIDLILSLNNLANFDFPAHIPRIEAYNNGWFGFVNTLHGGYITQKREKHVDLMLYAPFPLLKSYLDKWHLQEMSEYEYAHCPYPVILSKLKATSNNRKELKLELRSFIKDKVDMDNIQEAIDNVYYTYIKSEYPHVQELFKLSNSRKTEEWQIIHSISQFFNKYQRLPVSLEIPDLKATTQGYLEFKKIYSDQFTADCLEIQNMSKISNLPLIEEISKSIRDLMWVEPKKASVLDVITFSSAFDVQEHGLQLYNYLQQHLQFRRINNEFPNKMEQIKCHGILNGALCRGEIYGTSAIIGGIVAQEVIKFITKQYVPICKSVVYDGLSCQMAVIE